MHAFAVFGTHLNRMYMKCRHANGMESFGRIDVIFALDFFFLQQFSGTQIEKLTFCYGIPQGIICFFPNISEGIKIFE